MRQIHSFDVGAVLHASVSAYARNAAVLVPLFLLTSLPAFALVAMSAAPSLPPPPAPAEASTPADALAWSKAFWESHAWLVLADGFCIVWMQAAFAYAVVRSMRSRPSRLLEALWESLRALPYALIAGALAALLMGVGFMLFLLPGVIFMLMFTVVVPVAVVERRLGSALARSHHLTHGHKWSILGIWLLLFLFGWACELVVAQLAARFAAEDPDSAVRFVSVAVDAALGSLSATVVAVVYHDLRVLKDGADPRAVARVFE